MTTTAPGPYDIGDVVRFKGIFRDINGIFIDPTTVTLRLRNLTDATLLQYVYGIDIELIKDAVGHYHADIPITRAGAWIQRWVSTGVGQAAEQSDFIVDPDLTA